MRDDDHILILRGGEVSALLEGREGEIVAGVRAAYLAHAAGDSALPHSTFLRFPDEQRNRIIALPAYLGDGVGTAGVKWVSSFPGNLARGLDRASAVLILNSALTGRPQAICEGSVISAKRTAASAALAADVLHAGAPVPSVGLVGCGLINFEIVRFLRAVRPELREVVAFDLDEARGEHFKRRCQELPGWPAVRLARRLGDVLGATTLHSFATTAARPHVADVSLCPPGSTVLHVSLRDLSPEVILSCDNVVDDVDHVCREATSVHLAEQLVGRRDFIRCTLAHVLAGRAAPRRDADTVTVFSPFGLGVLDIAVGRLVYDLCVEKEHGTVLEDFIPAPWSGRP